MVILKLVEQAFYHRKNLHKWPEHCRLLAEYIDEGGRRSSPGIKMDIPPFLMSTFRILHDQARDIKRSNGPEVRTYIKYDDDPMSLYIDALVNKSRGWIQITPSVGKELAKEKHKTSHCNCSPQCEPHSPP